MEVIDLHGVLDLFLSELYNQRVIRRIRIRSPYYEHSNMAWSLLDIMYPQLNSVRDRVMSNGVGTISSCQGIEEEFIIFMARSGPLNAWSG